MIVTVGVAQRPMRGLSVCGDGYVILDGPVVVVGVVDGLGHGPEANAAAVAFCEYVRAHASDDVETLLRGAGVAMAHTRGGMGTLIRIDTERCLLSYAAIGNIELQARGVDRIRPISVAGILGKPLRKVIPFDYELTGDQVLYVYSDGISSRFDADELSGTLPQAAAELLLERYGKAHDDATVLVIAMDDVRRAPMTATAMATAERSLSVGPVRIKQEFDAVWCSRECGAFAQSRGLDPKATWEVAIAVSELVKNVARHAGQGTLEARAVATAHEGVEVVVEDDGPGIGDIEAAVRDGFSGGRMMLPEELGRAGRGLGTGLGAVQRLMDEVEITNKEGGGLRVVAKKWRR